MTCPGRRTAVSLALLAALLAACGGAGGPAPAVTTSPAAVITPAPPGTPGSQDPSHLAAPDPEIEFDAGALEWSGPVLRDPTTLAFGPDGRLYVGQLDGQIVALTLDGQTVLEAELIASADALGDVLGLVFNPAEEPESLGLYASHTRLGQGAEGEPFPGKVSRIPAAGEVEDVITGLPVSAVEHGTNGLAFDAQGRLYIAQGGTTNAGAPSERHPRLETPLSGAILIADLGDPDFDGRIVYAPPGEASATSELVSGDVRVFAAGFRNPYDLLWHSNGRLYATDNAPNPPDGGGSTGCATEGPGPDAADELNLVLEGGYYGHPNRNRGRSDERQCVYHPAGDHDGGVTPPIATLGFHTSANGIAEYTHDAFGGKLRGNLIYVEWNTARVWRVVLAEGGTGVESVSRLVPGTFGQPLDVAVGPDGTVYLAELGPDRITFLRPR